MGLPKLDVPSYEVTIPSTKQTIRIRPFLVKEQKILLTAMVGENPEEITNATKQIINNCVLEDNFDVNKLELFDLEYLILQLRVVSIGETTKLRFLPRKNTECKECSKHREVEVNLKNAQIDLGKSIDKKIQLTDTIGIIMKYPNAKMLGKIESIKKSENTDKIFELIWMCVDSVYDSESITSNKDVNANEGVVFLESLNAEQFSKIEKFLSSIPKLKQTIKIKCSECTFEDDFELVGLENFFG